MSSGWRTRNVAGANVWTGGLAFMRAAAPAYCPPPPSLRVKEIKLLVHKDAAKESTCCPDKDRSPCWSVGSSNIPYSITAHHFKPSFSCELLSCFNLLIVTDNVLILVESCSSEAALEKSYLYLTYLFCSVLKLCCLYKLPVCCFKNVTYIPEWSVESWQFELRSKSNRPAGLVRQPHAF